MKTFYKCKALTDASGVEGWVTSNVTSLAFAFYYCSKLTSLDLSGWDTSGVTTLAYTFYYCSKLTSLDLSGWDTSGVTTLYGTFYGCSSLTTIYASEDWYPGSVKTTTSTFYNCTSLVGGNGTAYSSSAYTGTMAVIDDEDASGYLTMHETWYITFDPNIDDYEGTMEGFTYDVKDVVAASDCAYTADGYEFAGWNTEADGTGTTYSPGDTLWASYFEDGAEITLYAMWTSTGYTVTFSANATDAVGSRTDLTWSVSGTYTVPTNPYYRLGYSFVSWNTEADGSGTTLYAGDEVTEALAEVGETITLYAQWEAIDTTVSLEDGTFTFTLHGGEAATFELPAGTSYLVYELVDGDWVLVSSSGTSGTITSNTTSVAAFENTYSEDAPTTATLVAMKTLDGAGADAGAYTFQLTDSTGTVVETVTNAAGGGVVFSTLSFDTAGTYTYYISEVAGTDSTITYDTATYTATITVTEDEDGDLSAEVVYTDADGNTVTVPTFANVTKPGYLKITKQVEGAELTDQTFYATVTYSDGTSETVTLDADNDWTWVSGELTPGITYEVVETDLPDGYSLVSYTNETGEIAANETSEVTITNSYSTSGSFNAQATKVLTGRTLTSGEFSFALTDADGNTLATAASYTDGSIFFDAVSLTEAGSYTYYITETSGTDATVTYDTHTATVYVVATDNGDGTLSTTVTYGTDDESSTFTNAVNPGWLTITKVTEDTIDAESDVTFTFQMTLTDANGEEVTDECSYTTTSGATGTIVSGGTIELSAGETATIEVPAGTIYTVTEVDIPDGFTLTSSDGAEGEIEANETSAATLTNTYDATGSIALEATKVLTGAGEIEGGAFTFLVLDEDGLEVARATNGASDSGKVTITFSEISYTLDDVGTHTYTVLEVTGTGAYTYDETEYEVTVTVTDNGDGTLSVTSDMDAEDIVFTNSATTELIFTKVDMSDTSITLSGATFVLYEYVGTTGSSSILDVDDVDEDVWAYVGTATSDEDGTVTFEGVSYGTTYRLIETVAPTGYVCPSGQWNVVVNTNGTYSITAIYDLLTAQPPAFATVDGEYLLPNSDSTTLPTTGGTALLYTLVGVVVMVGAAAAWFWRRRRTE